MKSSLRAAAALALLSVLVAAQGLPAVPVPPQNPLTPAKIILGKILFFEEQVGRDNTTACATCHIHEVGGGDPRALSPLNLNPGPDGLFGTADDVRGSRGIIHCDGNGNFTNDGVFFPNPQTTGRKAPSAVGAAWDNETFWDGRAGPSFKDPVTLQVLLPLFGALESQSVLPPASGEMSCQGTGIQTVCNKLVNARPMRLASNLPADIQTAIATNPTYPALFQAAFGDPAVTPARFAMAIASYERTLVPDQTPWDAFMAGNTSALTPNQQAGLGLFNIHCTACHAAPLFTNHSFHNIGLRPPAEDPGRQNVTGDPADRGKFKTPGLRNVGLRAPYFHNGGAVTLWDAVEFYNRGGDFGDNRDTLMSPLGLTHQEKLDLHDFLLHGLTDARVANALPPFDRPTLYSELQSQTTIYGARYAGTNGVAPRLLAHMPPMIGADRFGVGLANGLGGALAVLGVSVLPPIPGLTIGNAPLWIGLDPSTLLVPLVLSGAPGTPGVGYASLVPVLPDTPALDGVSLFCQAIVVDPGAPGGFASTEAAEITFFRP